MKKRLSITLDRELYNEVKRVAEECNKPISHIVENAIRNWKRDEIKEGLKQYYTSTSKEHRIIVKEAELMVEEIWEEDESEY